MFAPIILCIAFIQTILMKIDGLAQAIATQDYTYIASYRASQLLSSYIVMPYFYGN